MPTKIEIHILGLALCFHQPDAWNVVFVCDDVHPARFTYPNGGGTSSVDLHARGRDLEISIISDEFIPPSGGPYGDDFDYLFNMADAYAHGEKNLRIFRRKKITDVLRMRIPSATLGVTELTDNDYFVQDLSYYPGAPVEVIGKVGKEVVINLEVQKGFVVRVTDPSDPDYLREFSIGAAASVVELQFYNDCENACTHNDFLDLYEFVVDDGGGRERKFAAGQVKNPTINGRRVLSKVGSGPHAMSPQYGNCDPVGIEPPPSE